MSMTEKIDKLLNSKNITKSQLSKESGIPYTTISGFYVKGTDNVKLSTLKKLADYFQCSLDYLVYDDVGLNENIVFNGYINMFAKLNREEKELTYKAIRILYKNKEGINYIGN
ncbi:XRE family transcriptional regulator [Clostridioides difficile]|nr:XRE family transcriptional regulator [Clostridioides difficile]EGT3953475.1 XRE family transcriptional regulator [Clostridioides difficile]EGT4203027.1 XRE family transcriptional regulator [Clostridioides difficile]EJX3465448.1 helix-turn-helix transcriptional regulator [Clostridioides difficile]ELX4570472.1 helix-turn-helix transcriptional regulator [Clostridioides difficile]